MSKITVYILGEGASGAPRRLCNLADGLRKRGVDCQIRTHKSHAICSIAKDSGVPISYGVNHSPSFLSNMPRQIRMLVKVFLNILDSILHICSTMNTAKQIVILRGTKSGLTHLPLYLSRRFSVVLDIDYEDAPSKLINLARSISIPRANVIVTQYSGVIDDFFCDRHAEQLRQKSITVAPGINVSELKNKQGRECIPENKVTYSRFLHIGKIHRRKNQLFALKILNNLVKNHGLYDFRLDFIGGVADLDYKKEIDSYIATEGLSDFVRFRGWTSNIHAYMSNSRFLFLTSLNEGVPNTVQEAMLFGLPVFCSDVGGIRDIVQDGITGFVFKDFDDSLWANRVVHLLRTPKRESTISINQVDFALKNFTLEGFADKYVSSIQAQLGRQL